MFYTRYHAEGLIDRLGNTTTFRVAVKDFSKITVTIGS